MAEQKNIVVIGGSAAGPKAASRARRMDPKAAITMIQKGPDFSMASCGYPYFVGGTFDERSKLLSTPTGVVRDANFFAKAKDIKALSLTEVTSINRQEKTISCSSTANGETFSFPYDKLVIATGATPIVPPIKGVELEGVTTLQSMADADYLQKICKEKSVQSAVVIGGGLIGVEACEALQQCGIKTTIVEMLPQILAFMDSEFAALVTNHIKSKGAQVILENPVAQFVGKEGKLTGVTLKSGEKISCQLAVVATGVRPNTALAKEAGLEIGQRGGILVDEFMNTSDPDIYAAGDCVEIKHLITGENVHAPYGDLANLQGRVVGRNVIEGNVAKFAGTYHTGICKIFDWSAGATGLSEKMAKAAKLDIETVVTAGPDKPGFMGAKLLYMKMIAEKSSGKLLGLQCVGPGDVSKRIAQGALALRGQLSVSDLTTADLPYAPPFSPAIDNLITAANVLENKMNGYFKSLSCLEVKKKMESSSKPFLLDTRGPDEYEQMRLGIGEKLIPLGALRSRLSELPEDKSTEIICYCKVSARGFEALRLLQSLGYTDVKIMEGGVMAWPYERER